MSLWKLSTASSAALAALTLPVIISSVQRCITSILIYIYSNQFTHKTLSITMVRK